MSGSPVLPLGSTNQASGLLSATWTPNSDLQVSYQHRGRKEVVGAPAWEQRTLAWQLCL